MSARSGNTAWVRACLACVAVVALVGLAADAAGATSLRAKKGQALAKRAVLRRSDFPPGWRSQDSTESRKQGDRVRAEIRDCRRYRAEAVRFRSHAHAASPDFLQPTAGLRVSNQAAVFPSANAASADLRIVSDPKTAPCLEKAADVAVRARLRQQG